MKNFLKALLIVVFIGCFFHSCDKCTTKQKLSPNHMTTK